MGVTRILEGWPGISLCRVGSPLTFSFNDEADAEVELVPGVLELTKVAGRLIVDQLELAGHDAADAGAFFRPLHYSRIEGLHKTNTPDAVYKIVRGDSAALGFEVGAHAPRPTAATHALDRCKTRPEDSPTFKLSY